jgi:DnaJ-domain-containing protein 1
MHSGDKDTAFPIPVAIEFTDGQHIETALLMPRQNMKIMDLLNRGSDFLEIQSLNGEVVNIAKAAIRSLRKREVPKAKDLGSHLAAKGGFDPHEILRVPRAADAEAIRHSYLALVREYHPDGYAAMALPKEVGEYLTAMLTRINAAYSQLAPKADQAA